MAYLKGISWHSPADIKESHEMKASYTVSIRKRVPPENKTTELHRYTKRSR
jgi:hypothetical protein